MSRMNKKLLLIGLLAVTALVVSTSEANAFHGWYGYGYPCCSPVSCYSCYTPCYNPCCYTSSSSSCCDPCCDSWTLGVRPGPVRRWLFGPYRWYRANDCCWTGCQSCCYSGCGYTTGGNSCCGPTMEGTMEGTDNTSYPYNEPTKAAPPSGEEGDNNMSMPTTIYPTHENSAVLTVWAPSKAKITINGYETKSEGSKRRYVSTGLQPGLTYKYVVVAQLPRNGKMAEETQTVYLTAGSQEGVAFGFNKRPVEALAAAQ